MDEAYTNASLSPNHTYFPIPSLYAGLPETDVQAIEQILASDFAAAVPEAEEAFAALPERLRTKSVVVIARAINFLFLWNFRAAHDFLEKVDLSGDLLGNLLQEESLLIRSLFAFAKIIFVGSFELARTCLAELKSLFAQAHLQHCTDLTVWLVPGTSLIKLTVVGLSPQRVFATDKGGQRGSSRWSLQRGRVLRRYSFCQH